ncbi:MAG: hypothetical protein HC904_00190 [Blastochloris sp.]|nr:hypothetical protein [Blastochloris sp.]
MRKFLFLILYLGGVLPVLWSQRLEQAIDQVTKPLSEVKVSADAKPPGTTSPAANPTPTTPGVDSSQTLGRDLPFLDPSSEVVSWDGKLWNIKDNRIFRARFEKYLNSPEEPEESAKAYKEVLNKMNELLDPAKTTRPDVNKAWSLLPQASGFSVDANLCDSLASAVYNVWSAQKSDQALYLASQDLQKQRDQISWNAQQSVGGLELGNQPPKDEKALAEWTQQQQMKRQIRMQPYMTRLAEVEAMMKANQVKREVSEIQSKIEFQALILQLFMQRRFDHVLLGTAFYRQLFGDGDTKLKVGSEAEQAIGKYAGVPPTLGILESLAREAIKDVREGVEAYNFLVEKKEMASASDRLAEAFAVGENLLEIRTLPRERKRLSLGFAQKSNQLLSALEVKDYEKADTLVADLQKLAQDFDTAKPLAAIQTARTISAMLLDKARTAAINGDRTEFESVLKSAADLWPRNPRLSELSSTIFNQADQQQQALVDLDRLISQKNHREIFENRVRYIVASANYPDRQEKLKSILEEMQVIESSIIRSTEAAKMGTTPGPGKTWIRWQSSIPRT